MEARLLDHDSLADLKEIHQSHGHLHLRGDAAGRRNPDLGWWDPVLGPHAAALTALAEYAATHGNLKLPPAYTHDDLNLSAWLTHQRSRMRTDEERAPVLRAYLDKLDATWTSAANSQEGQTRGKASRS